MLLKKKRERSGDDGVFSWGENGKRSVGGEEFSFPLRKKSALKLEVGKKFSQL